MKNAASSTSAERNRRMYLLPAPKRPGAGNAFEVLGVSQEASLEEIKRAFLYFAQIYHPDHNPDGHDEFTRINQAYLDVTKHRDFTEIKMKCDVVEAKARHVDFLKLAQKIMTLAGIEIPPVPSEEMARRDDADQAFNLGFALVFRCPWCEWKKKCDRATGFDEVENFHNDFMSKAMRAKRRVRG